MKCPPSLGPGWELLGVVDLNAVHGCDMRCEATAANEHFIAEERRLSSRVTAQGGVRAGRLPFAKMARSSTSGTATAKRRRSSWRRSMASERGAGAPRMAPKGSPGRWWIGVPRA